MELNLAVTNNLSRMLVPVSSAAYANICSYVRGAALPFGLLVPRWRLAPGRAGGHGAGAGVRGAGPDRSQLGLRVDGVRRLGARAWPAPHPWRRDRPGRWPASDAAGPGR